MALSRKVKEAIEAVVRERFDSISIADVHVEEGEDHDGDPSLFVRIVFDAEVEDLDAHRMVSITRHLRNRLADLGEERFPYTRFLSKADFEGLAA